MDHPILIIHPQRECLTSIKEVVRRLGYDVKTFDDPSLGLHYLRSGAEVSLLLADSLWLESSEWDQALAVHAPDLPFASIDAGIGDSRNLHFPASSEGLEANLNQILSGEKQSEENCAVKELFFLSQRIQGRQDLDAIVALGSRSMRSIFPRRPYAVQMWDPLDPTHISECGSDVAPDPNAFWMSIDSDFGIVGRIVLDKHPETGSRVDMGEQHIMQLVGLQLACNAQVQWHLRERERSQQGTLLAMAKVAEMRDNETGQHLLRVSHYAELVARGLREDGHYVEQITEGFIKDMVRCAPLHDLGKVAIPDAVLLKRGRLDPDEWELMKTHPEWGARILREMVEEDSDLGFVAMGEEIAHCHHERWDGTGYPRGLAKEDIPLSARIVSLADIYDALTTPRPYKLSWPQKEVLEHLENLSGNALDPAVVSAFLKRADQAAVIQERFKDPEEGEEDGTEAKKFAA